MLVLAQDHHGLSECPHCTDEDTEANATWNKSMISQNNKSLLLNLVLRNHTQEGTLLIRNFHMWSFLTTHWESPATSMVSFTGVVKGLQGDMHALLLFPETSHS